MFERMCVNLIETYSFNYEQNMINKKNRQLNGFPGFMKQVGKYFFK